jgi:DNA-binding transcriptional LysR family regulator
VDCASAVGRGLDLSGCGERVDQGRSDRICNRAKGDEACAERARRIRHGGHGGFLPRNFDKAQIKCRWSRAIAAKRSDSSTNPGLTIELLASSEKVNFSRWEADLAVRLLKPERGDFTIQKLADTQLYFFEPAESIDGQSVTCCYPEQFDRSPETEFLKSRGLQSAARCITDNARVIRNLIRTRSAVGILPDYLCGDLLADPRLRATPVPRRRDTWLLIQSHLKGNSAARIVIDWIREQFTLMARR